MKVRDVVKMAEADDWVLVRTKGSHRIYKHPTKPGNVVVPGHPSKDLQPSTLDNILKQAGLK
jgi:predicted RNA binding protein YcfA (HicA-like mRNA interferase family)